MPLFQKVLEQGAPARWRLDGQSQLWAQCLVTVVAQLCGTCVGRRKWLGTAGYRWPDLSSFLSQVVKACNEGVRKMSRTEQMISIQKKMEFKIKVSLHPSVCVRPSPVSWSVAHWPGSLNGHSGVSEQGHLPEAFPDPWLEGRCVFPSHQAITLA